MRQEIESVTAQRNLCETAYRIKNAGQLVAAPRQMRMPAFYVTEDERDPVTLVVVPKKLRMRQTFGEEVHCSSFDAVKFGSEAILLLANRFDESALTADSSDSVSSSGRVSPSLRVCTGYGVSQQCFYSLLYATGEILPSESCCSS
jgi:hypothetical protein